MYYTSEHSILKSQDGKPDVELIPYKEFQAFRGDYIVTSFARIRKKEDDSIVVEIQGGDKIIGIGEIIPKPRTKATTEPKGK